MRIENAICFSTTRKVLLTHLFTFELVSALVLFRMSKRHVCFKMSGLASELRRGCIYSRVKMKAFLLKFKLASRKFR